MPLCGPAPGWGSAGPNPGDRWRSEGKHRSRVPRGAVRSYLCIGRSQSGEYDGDRFGADPMTGAQVIPRPRYASRRSESCRQLGLPGRLHPYGSKDAEIHV